MRKIICLLLISFNTFSQKESKKIFFESFSYLNNHAFENAEICINKLLKYDSIKYNLLKNQLKYLKKGTYDSIFYNDKALKKDTTNIVLNNIDKGDYLLFNLVGYDTDSFNYYKKAFELAYKKKDTLLICETSKKIMFYLQKFNRKPAISENYLSVHREYAYNNNERAIHFNNNLIHGIQLFDYNNIKLPQDKLFYEGIEIANLSSNKISIANIYQTLGVKYASKLKNFKKAISFFEKSFSFYKTIENSAFKNHKTFNYYISLGASYYFLKDYNKSLFYLKKGESISLINNKKRDVISLYNWLYKVYFAFQDFEKAFYYLKKSNILSKKINQTITNVKIEDIHTKYQTIEKENKILLLEKDNIVIESKRIKNRNFLIGALLFILLGGTIGYLSLKNTKKKQKLAEQQKKLEIQKNLTLLKEQEITNINAMVDGQEKERKQIAEDLHDNLGSVLATLKLHFENLKINKEKKKINQDVLFNKTESLIDEAYLKVRRIAHAKNAGVIANQGLLIAVQMMAEKISSADKIKIEVINFGLNKRLENSLEITVFRIIQELVTNTIKHAEAKNTTINISQYDGNLNIIIEDNGKGFDIHKVNLKDGMGLQSIKTRIAHLKGTFEVDSTPNKGTSIIINIPITS